MDVDLVRLRYFAAVAEHLHFGRAAAALHMSRLALSHAVLELEELLGVELFVRPSERTELTDAGRKLLEQARARIAEDDLATVEAAGATDEARPFTIGIVPGVTVSKWTRLWAERRPKDPLEVLRTEEQNQVSVLHSELVDVSFVRLPIATAGLSTIALYAELPVVVVPKDHPSTLLDMVTVADLVDEYLLQDPDTVPQWRDAAAAARTAERRPLPEMRTMADTVALVAAGIGIVIVPQSVARLNHRKDVTYLPVVDVAPYPVALAWLAEHTTAEIEEFIGIVRGRSAQSSRTAPVPGREQGARSTGKPADRSAERSGATPRSAGGATGRRGSTRGRPAKAAPKSRRGRPAR